METLKDGLKFLVFAEFMTLITCGIVNLIAILCHYNMNGFYTIYWACPLIIFAVVIIAFILVPLVDWWFN